MSRTGSSTDEGDLQTKLEENLAKLGAYGTKFVERLDGANPIPAALNVHESRLLQKLNAIASLVSSPPYSAVVLRESILYIAQNKESSESPEGLESRLKTSEEYHRLSTEVSLSIRLVRFDRAKGDHPDTVAIAASLEDVEPAKRDRQAYIGLAAFNTDGSLNSQVPASCSTCGAVIKALNSNGYQFKVALYTSTNFPSNRNYRIPTIISEDAVLFDSYLDNIYASVRKIEKKISPENEENLYIQYVTQEDKRTLMRETHIDDSTRQAQIRYLEDNARTEYRSGAINRRFKGELGAFKELIENTKQEIFKSYSNERIARIAEEKSKLVKKKEEIEERVRSIFKTLPPEQTASILDGRKLSIVKVKSQYDSITLLHETLADQIAATEARIRSIRSIIEKADVQRHVLDEERRKLEAIDKPEASKKPILGSERRARQTKQANIAILKSSMQAATAKLSEIESSAHYQKAAEAHKQCVTLIERQQKELQELGKVRSRVKIIFDGLNDLERVNVRMRELDLFVSPREELVELGSRGAASAYHRRASLEAKGKAFSSGATFSALPALGTEAPRPAQVAPTIPTLTGDIWYNEDNMLSIFSRNPDIQLITGEPEGIPIRVIVTENEQLRTALSKIPESDGEYVVPMRINVVTTNFAAAEGENNHWVGVHVSKTGSTTEVAYIDPTGRPINSDIRGILESTLGKTVTDHQIRLQHGKIKATAAGDYWDGNSNDCGPLTIHMLSELSKNNIAELQAQSLRITNISNSRALGQDLRSFHEAMHSTIPYIGRDSEAHGAAVSHSSSGSTQISLSGIERFRADHPAQASTIVASTNTLSNSRSGSVHLIV